VLVVIVIVGLALVAGLVSRRRSREMDMRRTAAEAHRQEALSRSRSAEAAKLEADEQAARAERAKLEAEDTAARASQERDHAREHLAMADEIDPDVDRSEAGDAAPVDAER
jgi:hypothetical protein